MTDRFDQMTADDLPATRTAYRSSGSDELSEKDEQDVDAALKEFTDAIDGEVAERLAGDEALRERLDRIRHASKKWALASDELVSYGYDSVTLWMRLVLASERSPVGLAERDLVDIAKETVARALNALADESLDDKVAFLTRCADQLPPAYEAWRLRSSVLDVGEFEESVLVGKGIIDGLRFCMADVRLATQLMRRWARDDIDVIDLVTNTRRVLRRSGAIS
jgi:hypothetical protein